MEFYTDLKTYLADTLSIKQDERKTAEAQIRIYRDQDPRKFLASLTKELADETNNESARMTAAILTKNFIANRGGVSDLDQYEDYWVNLDQEFKEQLKVAFLACLATNSLIVRKQVSGVVAIIASIEIPRKEWLDLIPNLSANSEHESYDIRYASLETLGFICEELSPSDLTQELKNRIVSALVSNIQTDQQYTKTTNLAVKALLNALPYATHNFSIESDRNFIMQKIFQAIKSQDEDIRFVSMQILCEFGRQEYEMVQYHFKEICDATALSARSDIEKVGALGIEFWTSLAEEEQARIQKNAFVKNYISQCYQDLVALLVECIQRVNIQDEEDEDDEFGVALSSGCCLGAISILVGNEIMEPILAFVSQNIQNPDWKKRYSALLALGAITEGPDRLRFMNVIIPGLQNLIVMFHDQSGKVREAIAWVMSKICENHSDVITNQQVLPGIIPILLQSLKDKPRISLQVCRAIENLAISTTCQENPAENLLTPYFKIIVDELLTNSQRTDHDQNQTNLSGASFSALHAICENAGTNSNNELYQLLMPTLQMIEQTLNPGTFGEQRSKDFQDYLSGLLQIILVRVGSKVDTDTAANIVKLQNWIIQFKLMIKQLFYQIKLLVMIFNNQKKVTENGLIALSGLINGVGNRLDINEFGKYVVFALKGNDEECLRLGCGIHQFHETIIQNINIEYKIVSDLANAFREQIGSYLQDFIQPLAAALSSADSSRQTKLQALYAIGDLAMHSGEAFSQQYLSDTLMILSSASKQSLVNVSESQDPDLASYLQSLRLAIVETYTTLLQGIEDQTSSQQNTQVILGKLKYNTTQINILIKFKLLS